LSNVPAYGGDYLPETVSSLLHPSLVSGTKYWVEIATASSALGTWNFNTTGANGLVFQTGVGMAPATLPPFPVNLAAAPEPSSFALGAVALACVAGGLRFARASRSSARTTK